MNLDNITTALIMFIGAMGVYIMYLHKRMGGVLDKKDERIEELQNRVDELQEKRIKFMEAVIVHSPGSACDDS